METMHSVRPLLAIAVSFFGALLIVASYKRPNLREFCTIITPLTNMKASRKDRVAIEDLRHQTMGEAASLGPDGQASIYEAFFCFLCFLHSFQYANTKGEKR